LNRENQDFQREKIDVFKERITKKIGKKIIKKLPSSLRSVLKKTLVLTKNHKVDLYSLYKVFKKTD